MYYQTQCVAIENGEPKIVIGYLKLPRYSSGETKTTIGIANLPAEVQEILIRWILPGRSRKSMKKSTTKAGVPA
jgi:hypothetical protein